MLNTVHPLSLRLIALCADFTLAVILIFSKWGLDMKYFIDIKTCQNMLWIIHLYQFYKSYNDQSTACRPLHYISMIQSSLVAKCVCSFALTGNSFFFFFSWLFVCLFVFPFCFKIVLDMIKDLISGMWFSAFSFLQYPQPQTFAK